MLIGTSEKKHGKNQTKTCIEAQQTLSY